MIFLSTWSDGLSGVMDIISQIWNGLFHIQFFGAGFTFGDLVIGLFLASVGISLIMFFSNHGSGSGSGSSGSGSDGGGISYG